jgi:hypothetical protein
MNSRETILPRLLAVVQVFVSLLMFGIIIYLGLIFLNGREVPPKAWAFPLTIMAIDCILIWLLSRRQLPFRLYLSAILVWLATTGYYVLNLRTLLLA